MIHIFSLITIIALTPTTIKIAHIFYNERVKDKTQNKSD